MLDWLEDRWDDLYDWWFDDGDSDTSFEAMLERDEELNADDCCDYD